MALFKKSPEPRSWSGETTSEQYQPKKCSGNSHLSPRIISEYWTKDASGKQIRMKSMTCGTCGADWSESA
jgi:hypothetical protein